MLVTPKSQPQERAQCPARTTYKRTILGERNPFSALRVSTISLRLRQHRRVIECGVVRDDHHAIGGGGGFFGGGFAGPAVDANDGDVRVAVSQPAPRCFSSSMMSSAGDSRTSSMSRLYATPMIWMREPFSGLPASFSAFCILSTTKCGIWPLMYPASSMKRASIPACLVFQER